MRYTKIGSAHFLLLGLWIATAQQTLGGIIGTFDKVTSLPGYIDFNHKSPWYKGVVKSAKIADKIERRTPAQILDDYFVADEFREDRLLALIQEVRDHHRNSFIRYCMEKLPAHAPDNNYCLGEVTDEKLLKKWRKKESHIVLEYIIAELTRALAYGRRLSRAAINKPESEPFLNTFFAALNIYEAIEGEDRQQGRYTGTNQIALYNLNNLLLQTEYVIDAKRPESANLPVPARLAARFPNQRFLSLQNIEQLRKEAYDLSLLDPLDSGLWRKPQKAIRRYDLTRYDGDAIAHLSQSMPSKQAHDFLDPAKEVDLVYSPGKFRGGTLPKLYAKIGGDKWKVKFLTDRVGGINSTGVKNIAYMLMNSAEVNVENVVNNLAAAIGYTVDPTYYKHKIRLFFPDEVYERGDFQQAIEDMARELEASIGDNIYVRTALRSIKVDAATGRKYIEIRGTNLEKKSDRTTDRNIGLFHREGLGKALQREHRAMMLFLAWIADVDTKDDNVRLKLIPSADQDGHPVFHTALSNSDMGSALGFGFPNYLAREFVKSVKRKRGVTKSIRLEYRKVFPVSLLEAITIDDAKWLTRRIAQFTSQQMLAAFVAAGFPELVARVFVEKMMARRNQLVDALGLMGTTIVDDEGQALTIEPEKEYQGSIPGYERFFKDGLFTDIDNELFDPTKERAPRYWGTYWNNTVKDKPQSIAWRHGGLRVLNESLLLVLNLMEPGAYVTNYGPTFAGINLYRGSSAFSLCRNNCFFQGIGLGIGTFAPLRFIADNPDRESPEPFLVVDVFRIGLSIGSAISSIQNLFNLSAPPGAGGRIGGRGFRIYEFMKIRAVKDIDEYALGYKASLKQTPRLMFTKARQQFIESMEPGDTMVLSTYTGVQGRAQYLPLAGVSGLTPQVTIQGEVTLTSRATIHKQDEQQMLANWANIDVRGVSASSGLWALFNLNAATASRSRSKQIERTFLFDMNSPSEARLLMNSLHASHPQDIPPHLSVRKRQKFLKQGHLRFGFLTVVNKATSSRRTEMDFYDYLSHTVAKELSYERSYSFSHLVGLNVKSREYVYKTSVNEDNDVFMKVSLDLNYPQVRKEKFLGIINRISPMVPDDFIVFDPIAVKDYMGEVAFHGSTIFSNAALESMFALDPQEVCRAYVKVNHFANAEAFCGESKFARDHHLRAFMKDFLEAKTTFQALKEYRSVPILDLGADRDLIWKQLKELTEVFGRYSKEHFTVKLLQELLPLETYSHQGVLSSSLGAFPVDESEIEISLPRRGKFKPEIRHLAEHPEDIYALFSDDLHARIGRFFYSPSAHAGL